MMNDLMLIFSTLAPFSMVVMFIIFGELSRRLGEVVKAGKKHRWFYVAAGLGFISIIVRLSSVGGDASRYAILAQGWWSLAYILPMALGLGISLVVAWRYWGWLIYATEFGQPPR